MDKSRRVSISASLFDRLEKIAQQRMIGPNLIVEKAVQAFVEKMEMEPPLP